MSVLRIGMVGTGEMAARMLAAVRTRSDAVVSAVASASGDAERAAGFAGKLAIPASYPDIHALLSDAQIDLVYVATATHLHEKVSIAALGSRKPVLCEKPLAGSLAAAARVIDAARANDTLFAESLWTLLLPSYCRARSIVQSGQLGGITHLSASFGYPSTPLTARSAFAPDGGGVLLDRAVYPVALAVYMLGAVDHVACTLTRMPGGVDTDATLQLVHSSGATSQLAASLTSLLPNQAFVCGTRGSVMLASPLLGSEAVAVAQAAPESHDTTTPSGLKQRVRQGLRKAPMLRRVHRALAGGRSEHWSYGSSQYGPVLEHFLNLTRARSRQSEVLTYALSLEVARVLEQARSLATTTGGTTA